MNRRLLLTVATLAAIAAAIGLLGADYPVARAIRASGWQNAEVVRVTLAFLDAAFGKGIWYWLAATTCIAIGALGLITSIPMPKRLSTALLLAGLVQLATLHTMIFMKGTFGRLRPFQVFESGQWDTIWFSGGGSFPSGHSAYYFGLLLPLAAFAKRGWLRAVLIGVAVFVVFARINMERHFISDVSTSALIAALYSLLAAFLASRVPMLADAINPPRSSGPDR